MKRGVLLAIAGATLVGVALPATAAPRPSADAPPTTIPSSVTVTGAQGVVTLSAASTAPAVAFRVDAEPLGAPIPVRGGQASAPFATWGFGDGTHQVSAYDCTTDGRCDNTPATAPFTIANPSPSITVPTAGSTITGLVAISVANPAGGPLRLLIDNRVAGTATRAPYQFSVSASGLADGRHTLVAVSCTADWRRCQGPQSAPVEVTSAGLHPVITSVIPDPFSPNGDHVKDTARLSYRLPDTEQVHLVVTDSAGAVVKGGPLGTLPAGSYSYTWNGIRSPGHRFPDGTYTLILATGAGHRRGWVGHPVVIDTRTPTLTRPTGGNALFYPYPDGYHDTFTTHTTVSDAGTLAMTVRNSAGHVVQVVRTAARRGPAAVTWNGRDSRGRLVAAGTYTFGLALTDAAGNTGRTAWQPVRVSGQRLRHETLYVTKAGARVLDSGGTDSCARTHRTGSTLQLVNSCASDDFDLAYADYAFTVPGAISYGTLTLQAYGWSGRPPAELAASFEAPNGTVGIPGYRTVRGTAWYSIAGLPASGQIGAHRVVHASVLLDSTYPGRNDFTIVKVRLRVTVVRLA